MQKPDPEPYRAKDRRFPMLVMAQGTTSNGRCTVYKYKIIICTLVPISRQT